MIKITQKLLTSANRPKKPLVKLKGVVMHWTANTGKGANAISNRNYFQNSKRACSAHYVVDDHEIVQCVPDMEIAYHVGASKYTVLGDKIRENKARTPNSYLIGIEMCVNSDGNWSKTYLNSVALAAYLLNKYKLTINQLYRHYDITLKDCPKMMIDKKAWLKFKADVSKMLKPIKK